MRHFTFTSSEVEPLLFSHYLSECQSLIKNRRYFFEMQNIDSIIESNMPFNLYPADPILNDNQQIKYGALLVHGLLDSPFTLKEIGQQLQIKGILSRAILLPGHGTRPDDLLTVSYQDWIKTVRYGVETLKKEVGKVFLIGYSTGAALSIYHALEDQSIAGIILLAPAIKIKISSDLLATWQYVRKQYTPYKDWIIRQDEIDYAKYISIPFKPVQQVHELLDLNQQLLKQHSLSCPMHIIMSEDDETVSSTAAIEFFLQNTHQLSQFILYSNKKNLRNDARISLRTSKYSAQHIKNFSHIALPFSPDNSHYGKHGDYPLASKYADKIQYGAYNYFEKKIHNKLFQLGITNFKKYTLTYNPDFKFMMESIVKFIL